MNRMEYKGHTAEIEYSAEDRVLVGRVLDIRDVIVFHADNVEDIEKEFHGMIDFYLEQCAKDAIKPRRPPVAVGGTGISKKPAVRRRAAGRLVHA